MASFPGRYGKYSVRPRAPGNARSVTPEVMEQESNQRILVSAQAAIAQPLVGVTTDGRVIPGLFPLE